LFPVREACVLRSVFSSRRKAGIFDKTRRFN